MTIELGRKIETNSTDLYPSFPYLSMRGMEFNFISSVDSPIVFTNLNPENQLVYGHSLVHTFDPSQVVAIFVAGPPDI